MADRYWRGGTGTWSSTNTANWSTSSGGSGGASVPTAADNVIFDANSNTGTANFTVTMANTPRVCNDFTASGLDGTMTLAGSGIGLTVSGSLTFQATNFTRTYTGTTTFNATTTGKTVTTNGVAFGGGVVFNGVGGSWTLGSAINTGGNSITVTNGTFDTSSSGNYAVTCLGISSSNSNTRTINLNASTITCSGTTTALNFTTITNLTFNAGTSQINLSSSSPNISTGGLTFYNVSFTATTATTLSITGANTFNNLTITGRTNIGIGAVTFSANQTINGTLTLGAGTASAYRTFLASNTIGTPRTLTVNALAAGAADIDFRDITVTGSAAPLTGTRFGDAKGNSGITFPAAKTVYWRAGTANWGTSSTGSWSLTSGGAFDATAFPLAQDTAIFPSTIPTTGSTVTINASYNIGTIDMSLRTSNTMTLAIGSTTPTIYGDWTNGTGITLTSSSTITFAGRQTQTITSAGITFPFSINLSNLSNTVRIVGNTGSVVDTTLNGCTLDLNGYSWTCGSSGVFSTSGTSNLTFNGGTLQFNNLFTGNTGFTTTQGSSAGKIVAGGGTSTFNGGGLTYNCTLEISSSTSITIYGSNTFTTITNTVSPLEIIFDDVTTTTVTNWNVNGTAGNLINIHPFGSAPFYFSKASGVVSSDYLQLSDSNAAGGATWYAGANSISLGGNTGWIFTAPPSATATGNFLLFF